MKENLGFKTDRKRRIHGLNNKQKGAKNQKCTVLAKSFFQAKSLVVLQQSHSCQNDRMYGESLQDIPAEKRVIRRFLNASSVMVWRAISPRGKSPFLYSDKGIKINAENYLCRAIFSC